MAKKKNDNTDAENEFERGYGDGYNGRDQRPTSFQYTVGYECGRMFRIQIDDAKNPGKKRCPHCGHPLKQD